MEFPTVPHDIFSLLAGKYTSNNQLSFLLQLDQTIDDERLYRSIIQLLAHQPVLSCSITEREDRWVWTQRSKVERSDLLYLFGSEADFKRFIVEPFDDQLDCQLKVGIFRHETDTICVKINHACSDARGLVQLVNLLIDGYEEDGRLPLREIQTDRFYDRYLHSIPMKQMLNASPAPAAIQIPATLGESSQQVFLTKQVNESQFNQLKKQASKTGSTINDLLLTAYIRSLASISKMPDNAISVNMTVDLRRYLPQGEANAICNFSSGEFVTVPSDALNSFDEALTQVRTATRRLKSEQIGLRSAFQIDALSKRPLSEATAYFKTRRATALQTGLSIPYFSNIGLLSEKPLKLGQAEVKEAYLLGQALYAPGLILAASTYLNQLTVSFNFFGSERSIPEVQQLLDRLVNEELLNVC